jgi:membrane-associated protein
MSMFVIATSLVNLAQLPESPEELLNFITRLLMEHSYLVVFLGAALDWCLPSSGDLVMLAGGWFANSTGEIRLVPVMFVGALGAVVCDNTMYWTGRIGGQAFVNRLFRSRLLARFVSRRHFQRVEKWFYLHGGKTVVFGRFTPGLRAAMPLSAGLSKMTYPRFIAFDLIAIALWAVVMGTVGYLFGQYWEALITTIQAYGRAVFVLALVLVVGLLIYRRYRARG